MIFDGEKEAKLIALACSTCARRSVWPVIETISGSVQPASANIVTVVPRMSSK